MKPGQPPQVTPVALDHDGEIKPIEEIDYAGTFTASEWRLIAIMAWVFSGIMIAMTMLCLHGTDSVDQREFDKLSRRVDNIGTNADFRHCDLIRHLLYIEKQIDGQPLQVP